MSASQSWASIPLGRPHADSLLVSDQLQWHRKVDIPSMVWLMLCDAGAARGMHKAAGSATPCRILNICMGGRQEAAIAAHPSPHYQICQNSKVICRLSGMPRRKQG